jgi:folate-binding protein YgfZ
MSIDPTYHHVKKLSILKFSGADALDFLQGQLSNDIHSLSSTWQYSGYCNPKGRLLALFLMWEENDVIFAALDSSLVEAVIKRLKMYIMRSKVVVEELSDATSVCTIDSGKTAARFEMNINESIHTLYFGQRELHVDLSGALQGVNSEAWDRACVEACEPKIDAGNVELFVPQMVNLDLLNGINFKKGCYTGQEIVARMHYLGKLKQRMYVCEVSGAAKSGDKISSGERNVGNVVSVSGDRALAVIRRELLGSALSLESGSRIVPLLDQPYPIPE